MRFWAAMLLLGLCGCSTTVDVAARFPANDPEAAPLRKVAVADFNGPEGDPFAYAMEAMLANAEFDGRRYFVLVDSGRRGAGADGVTAAQYGRSVGAEGVYYGRMQTVRFENFPWETSSTHCVKKDDKGKCIKKETVVIPCLRRAFQMEVMPALVNVRSGHVVYDTRKTASAETSWCYPDPQPISDGDMIDGAINRILADIRPDIAPYNTVLKATVIEIKDGLSDADGKLFDAAVKAAGKGDLSTACHAWDGLAANNSTHPWVIYNIGVCAEANGDFAGALTHYEQARTLSPKPNRDVAESITRVTDLIAAQKELRRTAKQRK
jgi:hypothetical protein